MKCDVIQMLLFVLQAASCEILYAKISLNKTNVALLVHTVFCVFTVQICKNFVTKMLKFIFCFLKLIFLSS